MNEILERIKSLTEDQLRNPKENTYTILAHLGEETGEFCTAICIEDGSEVKGYKELEESSIEEALDMFICVMSLYYDRGGKTIDINDYVSKKLDKWERNIENA